MDAMLQVAFRPDIIQHNQHVTVFEQLTEARHRIGQFGVICRLRVEPLYLLVNQTEQIILRHVLAELHP